jgi:hypothetical protein
MATKKQKSNIAQQKITIIFGYSLFIVAIIAMIVSTVIPWSALLLNATVNHLNVMMILLSFIAAAMVPFLVAYIIGDKITRTKNKVTHHYNGVLFGVLAYWLSMFFSYAGSSTVMAIRRAIPQVWLAEIVISWPILATITVIAFIAVRYHARIQKAGESVITYKPYQVLLLTSVVALLALMQLSASDGYQLYAMLYVGVFALFIGITYLVFKKVHPLKSIRLTDAIVAFSFGIIAMGFAGQLTSTVNYTTPVTIAISSLGFLVTWVLYVWLIARLANRVR